MKIIRNSTFETNSSSTHSLCIVSEYPKFNEEILLKDYLITPFTERDIDDEEYYFTNIEDKLRYLYTAYIQSNCGTSQHWEEHPLCKNLHELLPSLRFEPYIADYFYVFEDVEWFFNTYWGPAECEIFNDVNELKSFLLEGVVCFHNRDEEQEVLKYKHLPKIKIFCDWSG